MDVRVNRKAQIVQAAETLLTQRGLSGVTTRAIAEAVPCSEGALYVHFHDRLELILAVLEESLPAMLTPLRALEDKVGTGTPAENLGSAVNGLFQFHGRVAPMLCSLFAESELQKRFRESLQERDRGPHQGIRSLARYIEQEQEQERISREVDAETAAAVLMATSFFHAFTTQLLGSRSELSIERLIKLVLKIPYQTDAESRIKRRQRSPLPR